MSMSAGQVAGALVLETKVDDSGIKAGLKSVEDEAAASGKRTAAGFTGGLAGLKSGVDKAFLPAVGILGGIGAMGMLAAKEAESAAIAQAKLATALNNSGFAEATVRVQEYAVALGKKLAVDNDDIAAVQQQLAASKALAATAGETGGYFDRVTLASYNMAAAMGTDAVSAAGMLSKAMTSPEMATALVRTKALTKAEADHIVELQKAGKTEEARAAIMAAVEGKFAGQAENSITATQRMDVAYKDMQENLGKALLPILEKVTQAVQSLTGFVSEHTGLVTAAVAIVGSFAAAIIALKGAFMVYEIATKVAAIATALFNTVISANAIMIAVLAIAALVAGIIWAYNNVDWFRELCQTAFEAVSTAFSWIVDAAQGFWDILTGLFNWVKENWQTVLLVALTGPVGLAIKWIVDNWDKVVEMFKSIGPKIAEGMKTLVNILTLPWRTAANLIIDLVNKIVEIWNGIEFTLPSVDAFGKTIGGFTIGTPDMGMIPNIPELYLGGTAERGGLALVGERGPEYLNLPTGASVIPLNRATGSTVTNVFQFPENFTGDKRLVQSWIREAQEDQYRNGQLRQFAEAGGI